MSRHNSTPKARLVFAYNLRKFRQRLNLSQEAFADLSELHRTYIGSVERGERNVSIDNMEKLADALKIDLQQLLNDKDYEKQSWFQKIRRAVSAYP